MLSLDDLRAELPGAGLHCMHNSPLQLCCRAKYLEAVGDVMADDRLRCLLLNPVGWFAGFLADVARVPPRAVRAVLRPPRRCRRRDLPLSVPAPPGAAGGCRATLAAKTLHDLPWTLLPRDPRVCSTGPLSRAADALPPPARWDGGPAPHLEGRRRSLLRRRGGAAAR